MPMKPNWIEAWTEYHQDSTPQVRCVRFTSEDDEIIRRDYAAYVPVKEIAARLRRSQGTLRQRILFLKLRRSNHVSKLLVWAPEHLKANRAAFSNEAFIAACHEWRKQQERDAAAGKVAAKNLARARARAVALATGAPAGRGLKIKMMYAIEGVTLQIIGDQFGITRERVRQILAKPDKKPTPGD